MKKKEIKEVKKDTYQWEEDNSAAALIICVLCTLGFIWLLIEIFTR